MKLYKFRSLNFPLDDKKSYARIIKNLEGFFWFSRFWRLNDILEGVYTTDYKISEDNIEEVFGDKNKYLIGCFSKEEALSEPLMGGHYSDGSKGMVLEIEINTDKIKILDKGNQLDGSYIYGCPVNYISEIYQLKYFSIEDILTSKTNHREYESEYRLLKINDSKDDGEEIQIGKITKVIFGNPYGYFMNNSINENIETKRGIYENEKFMKYIKNYEILKNKIEAHLTENDIPFAVNLF